MKGLYQFAWLTWLILMISNGRLQAQNPIVPPGLYMADPTARVWSDGRLYIYGSVDESIDYYCSHRYHVLTTDDMVNWEVYRDRFASKGPGDQVVYNDSPLYAPDCNLVGDTFYLYFCQPDPDYPEGVAVSTRPEGPFKDATPLDVGGYNQIDPTLFLDDDGQAYYVWGQFTAKMARMNPNMRTLDLSSLKDSVLSETDHYFHEGAHMVKRNGIYYLIYAHLGRAGMPTCIGYSISNHPMGPYTYGGVIIDNDHCDPGNWNNHGSIMEFKGQWYIFYHRSTHHSKMMRKACMEPIFFNEDGSIDEVEMTSQGASPPLKAVSYLPAERACLLHGDLYIRAFSADNEELCSIRNGDRAAYKYLDFGDGVDSVTVWLFPGKDAGNVRFRADMPWGPEIASVQVPASTGAEEWRSITCPVDPISGIHALWLVFEGEGDHLFRVDGLEFK